MRRVSPGWTATPVEEKDLPLLLKWRNQPTVRRVSFNSEEITLSEHMAWWDRTARDPSVRYYLVRLEDYPVGVFNFYSLDAKEKSGWWGFYTGDPSSLKGVSQVVAWFETEALAIETFFEQLGYLTLFCESFAFNKNAWSLHEKFGFKLIRENFRTKNGESVKVLIHSLVKRGSNVDAG